MVPLPPLISSYVNACLKYESHYARLSGAIKVLGENTISGLSWMKWERERKKKENSRISLVLFINSKRPVDLEIFFHSQTPCISCQKGSILKYPCIPSGVTYIFLQRIVRCGICLNRPQEACLVQAILTNTPHDRFYAKQNNYPLIYSSLLFLIWSLWIIPIICSVQILWNGPQW